MTHNRKQPPNIVRKDDDVDAINLSQPVLIQQFFSFLNRHKWKIFFGIVGIVVGYWCDASAVNFIKYLAGKSVVEVDALEGIYFIATGLTGAVLGGTFSTAAAYFYQKWKHPDNIVDFSSVINSPGNKSPKGGSPHSRIRRKSLDDILGQSASVSPNSGKKTGTFTPETPDTYQHPAPPYTPNQRRL